MEMEMEIETNHETANETLDARETLEHLYGGEFDSNMADTALALGREEADIEDIISGGGVIDEDLKMKIHALAQQREAL